MRKHLMIAVLLMTAVMAKAQDNTNRIGVGLGGYYRPAASMTLFWEHETRYHNAWEFFAEGRVLFHGDLSQLSQVSHLSLKGQWDSVGQGVTLRPRQYFSILWTLDLLILNCLAISLTDRPC